MLNEDEEDMSANELEQLRFELVKAERDAFAEDAEARGLVYHEDAGLYSDERGNALNEFGERV